MVLFIYLVTRRKGTKNKMKYKKIIRKDCDILPEFFV